jgi:hypothetical protein
MQVALLEADADQDVAGGGGREQEVRRTQVRRRPEGDQQPGHQRVPHERVEPVVAQCRRRSFPRREPTGLA